MARLLPSAFFERDTVKVAPDLLGKYLVRLKDRERLIGRIVEVEAYRGSDDPASHAFRGLTPRNAAMFGDPGHAYVYFTYGHHYCLNVTTQKAGTPGAVLLRALQPVEGINAMRRFRTNVPDSEKGDLEIWSSPRVGIREGLDRFWRFYLRGNAYVSKRGMRERKFRD